LKLPIPEAPPVTSADKPALISIIVQIPENDEIDERVNVNVSMYKTTIQSVSIGFRVEIIFFYLCLISIFL
jgi:hypothetical protein